jgi:hypothetical protein
MPPPTTTTRRAVRPDDQIGQRGNEEGVVIERRGARVGEAGLRRDLRHFDVEVVEDLEVVGHEADGADHDRIRVTVGGELAHELADVGPEPRLGGPARALPGHEPLLDPGGLGHQAGRLCQLLGIGVAGPADALGQGVRGEEDLRAALDGAERFLDARGEEGNQRRLGVPRRHGHEGGVAERGGGPVQVFL